MTSPEGISSREAVTDGRFYPSEILARRNRQGEALQHAITTVDDCEVFGKALTKYNVANALVHSTDADLTVLYHAATRIDRAAWNVVVAAADYHCARTVFAVQKALLALESGEA